MDLEKMSSREIVSYVRRQTGKRITISLKSKKSIIKKARELLGENIVKKLLSDDKKSTHTKKIFNEHTLDHFPSHDQSYATKATESYSKEKTKEIKRILHATDNCIKELLKLL
jgi:hypothetical protein